MAAMTLSAWTATTAAAIRVFIPVFMCLLLRFDAPAVWAMAPFDQPDVCGICPEPGDLLADVSPALPDTLGYVLECCYGRAPRATVRGTGTPAHFQSQLQRAVGDGWRGDAALTPGRRLTIRMA
ncbi:hypothetical protein C666_05095 [Thauera linaloolentis 47Lol = DSM 12138]|uniref:Uncharacterized protein n=1 Tax=Thauera linaloolentis (strain DSM 12138 / JCM 21573 / CCUG 41526 / CIP 105981 / IAM 15112 / NBRC 102519 / 47Lol) TaxID=1123367 RepID=N6Y617_THAL4|nr:hypothetical protein C666_05095 [Thauera linaloolentis 47Lol = DSM 12138]